MPYTESQQNFIDMIRESVKLQDPDTVADPAYQFTDDELWRILCLKTPVYNPDYTPDTIPDEEKDAVVILSRIELYWRLASATAPLYPLEAEDAKLQKNVRFDHYLALIKEASRQYTLLMNSGGVLGGGIINTKTIYTPRYHYSSELYNLATKPAVKLTVSGITHDSANLDWTKFNVKSGIFSCYEIYCETEDIIDEYAEYPIKSNINPKYMFTDIHRLKCRLINLQPNTTYHVLIRSIDGNGLWGFDRSTFETLGG